MHFDYWYKKGLENITVIEGRKVDIHILDIEKQHKPLVI